MTPTRRTLAFVPSAIALLMVALLASSAGTAVSFASGVLPTRAATQAPVQPTIARASGRATRPDGSTRAVFLHAQAPSINRVHTAQTGGNDAIRGTDALRARHASIAFATTRVPGAAVDARRYGVTSPGQPAPASRAPPLG